MYEKSKYRKEIENDLRKYDELQLDGVMGRYNRGQRYSYKYKIFRHMEEQGEVVSRYEGRKKFYRLSKTKNSKK